MRYSTQGLSGYGRTSAKQVDRMSDAKQLKSRRLPFDPSQPDTPKGVSLRDTCLEKGSGGSDYALTCIRLMELQRAGCRPQALILMLWGMTSDVGYAACKEAAMDGTGLSEREWRKATRELVGFGCYKAIHFRDAKGRMVTRIEFHWPDSEPEEFADTLRHPAT